LCPAYDALRQPDHLYDTEHSYLFYDYPSPDAMPELPEVEITRRGIAPHITGREIERIIVRNPRLRWPVPVRLASKVTGRKVERVGRRAKYLLLDTGNGSIIIHLGMSGSLRILNQNVPPNHHDHVDIVFNEGSLLRYHDPRRFGCILWARHPLRHKLLRNLGPEPLHDEFDGAYLYRISRTRSGPVKQLLMNSGVVSGIGNIYANEALFLAGIHPLRRANRISAERYQYLAGNVKRVLCRAITAGGTTLRDFQKADGNPGYFGLSLQVYGKEGEPCPRCSGAIKRRTTQQRSTYYCAHCQR